MIRNEKEQIYFIISAIAGIILWVMFFVFSMGVIIPLVLVSGLVLLYTSELFKANILGNAIKVSEIQYKEIHIMSVEISTKLGIEEIPSMFIFNGSGIVNAFALKSLSKKYIILTSSLIDLLITNNQKEELKFIIAHELAHHYAGHTSPLKQMLIMPSSLIPFLSGAYSRACEFSADLIALQVTNDKESAKKALAFITLGSQALSPTLNLKSFIDQEKEISKLFGYVSEIYSTHPRTTSRMLELENTSFSGKKEEKYNFISEEKIKPFSA